MRTRIRSVTVWGFNLVRRSVWIVLCRLKPCSHSALWACNDRTKLTSWRMFGCCSAFVRHKLSHISAKSIRWTSIEIESGWQNIISRTVRFAKLHSNTISAVSAPAVLRGVLKCSASCFTSASPNDLCAIADSSNVDFSSHEFVDNWHSLDDFTV